MRVLGTWLVSTCLQVGHKFKTFDTLLCIYLFCLPVFVLTKTYTFLYCIHFFLCRRVFRVYGFSPLCVSQCTTKNSMFFKCRFLFNYECTGKDVKPGPFSLFSSFYRYKFYIKKEREMKNHFSKCSYVSVRLVNFMIYLLLFVFSFLQV